MNKFWREWWYKSNVKHFVLIKARFISRETNEWFSLERELLPPSFENVRQILYFYCVVLFAQSRLNSNLAISKLAFSFLLSSVRLTHSHCREGRNGTLVFFTSLFTSKQFLDTNAALDVGCSWEWLKIRSV